MPRKNLIKTSEYYYHVTTRANHKHWFALPLEQVWTISIKSFNKALTHHPAIVSQYVLMANHYHLLIKTPNADIDKFMYWFNKTFSDLMRAATGTENRMFGSNYKWSLITTERYFYNVFRYIYQNPIRAGIVNKCEIYPYSTHFYVRNSIPIPFAFSPLDELEGDSDFLNDPLSVEKSEIITKGLKYTYFKEIHKRSY